MGSQGVNLKDALSAPCWEDEPPWPGHRAEWPAAAGDTNAVSILHNCFKKFKLSCFKTQGLDWMEGATLGQFSSNLCPDCCAFYPCLTLTNAVVVKAFSKRKRLRQASKLTQSLASSCSLLNVFLAFFLLGQCCFETQDCLCDVLCHVGF